MLQRMCPLAAFLFITLASCSNTTEEVDTRAQFVDECYDQEDMSCFDEIASPQDPGEAFDLAEICFAEDEICRDSCGEEEHVCDETLSYATNWNSTATRCHL